MFSIDRVAGVALVVLALAVLVASRVLPFGTVRTPGPAFMPVVLALLLLFFGLLLVAMRGGSDAFRALQWHEWRHAVAIVVTVVFFALALERLGYRLTVAVALLFLLGVMERKSVLFTLAFSLAVSAASFFVFSTLLRVPLPRGPFGI
jgi:putative tricarboxylic transport membrane protein